MSRRGWGVTLVETMAAIGAAIALAGVAAPLLVSAKERAAGSAEMSQLRALATAQSLYTADTGGIPLSTATLVQGGYVSRDQCSAPTDPTSRGIANELDDDISHSSAMYGDLLVPYRSSYIGLRELAFPSAWIGKYLKDKPGAGWLVSLTTIQHSDPEHWNSMYSGTYRRVCLDGSVQVRTFAPVMVPSINGAAPAQHDFFFFVDGSTEWKRKFISGSL